MKTLWIMPSRELSEMLRAGGVDALTVHDARPSAVERTRWHDGYDAIALLVAPITPRKIVDALVALYEGTTGLPIYIVQAFPRDPEAVGRWIVSLSAVAGKGGGE